jgi:hypothetical protein
MKILRQTLTWPFVILSFCFLPFFGFFTLIGRLSLAVRSSRRSRATEGPNGTQWANSRMAVRRSGPFLPPAFRDLRGHSVEDRAPAALAVIDRNSHHWEGGMRDK